MLPWITEGLLRSITFKNKMFRDLRVQGKNINMEYFKKYKNKLTTLLRNAERSYYKNKLELNKNNLAKLWKTLNEVINRKKQEKRSVSFKHNNTEISDSNAIANHFNKFFVNAPMEIYKKLPQQSKDPCSYVTQNAETIFLKPVTDDEVNKLLSKLKNTSEGYDCIKPSVVKYVKDCIIKPLVHICNLSLINGTFPSKLKIAKVVPIHKKGDTSSFSNYRPVSVLPVFSKLFEKLMFCRLIDFMDRCKILNEKQFGFRKNRATYIWP